MSKMVSRKALAIWVGIAVAGSLAVAADAAITGTGPLAVTSAASSVAAGAAVDGADVTQGLTTDAAAAAGGTGTISAKLREMTTLQAATTAAITAAALTPPLAIQGNASTDGSTTITTGGTAQNLFSAAIPAHGFEVCNPNSTEDLWVSDSTTAAANNTGSYRVALNGGCYSSPINRLPIQAISVFAATTGHKITARSY